MTNLSNILSDFKPSDYIGKAAYITSDNPRIAAINEIRSYGFTPQSSIPRIGEVFRFSHRDWKTTDQAGWAIYFETFINESFFVTCIFGSFKGYPVDKVIWSNKDSRYFTSEEQKTINEHILIAKREAGKITAIAQEEAKQKAQRIYNNASELSGHEYINKKGIKPIGAKSYYDSIALPVFINNEITSLQFINGKGEKKFLSGGKIKGGYMFLRGDKDGLTYVTEGWATGCSILEATGCNVYVCYNANNIYEVCSHVKNHATGKVIIASDNDYSTPGNPGLTKARKASEVFNFNYVLPSFLDDNDRGTDFNDLHQIEGLEALKRQLLPLPSKPKAEILEVTTKDIKKTMLDIPHGFIEDVYNFYMATSGNHQPGFAMQTALALTSLLCSRYFITDNDNLSSLYFINVGKTATGKEHCKRVIETILNACDMADQISGDGFTSGSAVTSMLLRRNPTIVVTDEFGRNLEAAANSKNSMQKEANTILMEVIGRPDGILRPKNYSTMTISNSENSDIHKVIHSPALVFVGLTTPSTFFNSIKIDSVLDGFLNRFILHVSDEIRRPRKKTSMIDVPQSIINWVKKIKEQVRKKNPMELSTEKPKRKTVYYTEQAWREQDKFEIEMIDMQNRLEGEGLEGLSARANEFSMRMALCLALSRDPEADQIHDIDVKWACDYMRKSVDRTLKEVRKNMYDSQYEKDKKDVLQAIARTENGISRADMVQTRPFSKFKKKELDEIIQSLIEADLIELEMVKKNSGPGRPTEFFKIK